ncbi:hypothetical protein ASE75_00720 [Sphingomonas sp. Leaf17]|nr:hypothetical protein ASE75_00720 [Sphingomonas sp. Leaf17]
MADYADPYAVIAALQARIAEQEAQLAHAHKTFAHASVAARIGVWECDLASNSLTWTDTIYDMFDLPRGSPPDRDRTVSAYTPESAARLDRLRRAAIAEAGSFSLDADIVTERGNRRVIRVTALVEAENGVAVRLFGIKQDVTEERRILDRMRYLASFDAMTGLANRAGFQARLADGDRPIAALLLVDLDGFKLVNDTHGHLTGDACLRTAADRLATACEGVDMVARIGGDEFAVIFADGRDVPHAADLAARIVETMADPVSVAGAKLAVGASVGVAFANREDTPDSLFARADAALYAAKAGGRGVYRIA